MRLRFAVLCAVGSAFAFAAMPGLAGAAPHHNRGLTINSTPNPINAGEGVLIYGQLKGSNVANQTIVLYHHISGTHKGYTVIGTTTTNANGFYEFTRKLNIVMTNRSWFTRLAGQPTVHSRTVYERVHAIVSLSASSTSTTTNTPVVFRGHVTPNHAGERVYLQEQNGDTDDWHTLKSGRLGPGSNYSITRRFPLGGPNADPRTHVLRVLFRSDNRNLSGSSDPVTLSVQQKQRAGFTINTSTPVISYSQSATLTGTLTGGADTAVTLCQHPLAQGPTTCNTAGATDGSGNYHFTVAPAHNTVYFVRETLKQSTRTAALLIGVKDIISVTESGPHTVGQADTFSGTVTPDKSGHLVYLERKGPDGDFHIVGVSVVQPDGSYSISHVFGTSGSKVFRTRIHGGAVNLGDVSNPVSVTVLPAAASSLTPAT